MSAVDEIMASLPLDQIAARVGEDPAAVRRASYAVLPALLGGLEANTRDPAGEASVAAALGQHHHEFGDGQVDLGRVDPADGDRIARHIFGPHHDDVVTRLGSTDGSPGLVAKLIPILAPIVLSYLAKRAGGSSGTVGSILSQILAGAAEGMGHSSTGGGSGMGSILGDVLGGLLGAGRR